MAVRIAPEMSADALAGTGPEPSLPVPPRYDGRSLLNLPATICAVLGAPTTGLAPALDSTLLPPAMLRGVNAVFLLVVDGLGRWQLDAAIAGGDAPTLAGLAARASDGAGDAALATITSVFPSSTVPALATLNTGLPPAAHGLLGWTVYLEEFGEPAELARWGPAARPGSYQDEEYGSHDPARFFGVETLHQRLTRAGVRPVAISPRIHRGTGLSAMLFPGAELHGYDATSGIPAITERVLAERPGSQPTYLYAYWPTLDTVAHHRGPTDAEHHEEAAALDFALGRWLGRHERRGGLLFLLTADHGHVASPAEQVVRLDLERELLAELLSPPTGERRLAYLHARPGRRSAVRALCAERLGSAAEILDSDEAFARGLFGPSHVAPVARRRAGDVILLARDGHQFVCPFSDRQQPEPLLGNHGALAPREMLVPLLALRL